MKKKPPTQPIVTIAEVDLERGTVKPIDPKTPRPKKPRKPPGPLERPRKIGKPVKNKDYPRLEASLTIMLKFKRLGKSEDLRGLYAVKNRLLEIMPEIVALSPKLSRYTITVKQTPFDKEDLYDKPYK